MEHNAQNGYGLWSLVIINSAVFLIFAFSLPSRRPLGIGAPLEPSRPSLWRSSPRCMGFP